MALSYFLSTLADRCPRVYALAPAKMPTQILAGLPPPKRQRRISSFPCLAWADVAWASRPLSRERPAPARARAGCPRDSGREAHATKFSLRSRGEAHPPTSIFYVAHPCRAPLIKRISYSWYKESLLASGVPQEVVSCAGVCPRNLKLAQSSPYRSSL